MNGLEQIALNMLQSNKQMAQTPLGQEFMNILQNRDYKRGVELANNLCQTYNTPKDQALQQARNFFHM